MKNIFGIFKFDLKNVAKNIIVFVVIIGIGILPALYSWFNIAANWDPYSNTAALDFAVCTLDKGYNYKALKINAGDEIVKNLKANPKMGWDFVSKKKALDGVKNGTYYAAVIIPKDFSENLLSVTTGAFKKAKVKYYVNEKKNAIAPKITDKGAEAIESSVNTTYVNKVTDVIATALNLTGDELSSSKEELLNKAITTLKNTKTDINSLKKTNGLFITTLDSINNLLKANEDMGPAIKSALAKAGVMGDDIKNTLKSLGSTSPQITSSLSDFIDQTIDYADNVDTELTSSFNEISKDADSAADRLSRVTKINNKIIGINDKVLSVLQKINQTFPKLEFKALTKKLNDSNTKQNLIISKINNACSTIRKTGSLPKNVQNDIKNAVSSAKTELSGVKTDFSGAKSKIDDAASKAYKALDNVSDFVSSIGSGSLGIGKVISTGKDTVDNLKLTFKNLNGLLDNTNTKIDSLIKKINDVKNSKKVEDFISPIIESPEKLADFVSSPVSTDKERLYPIENYGSAMTPFYTSLGLWVGGVVLVAVISVELTKRQQKALNEPKPYQVYFGRYLIFFFIGQIQALVISLGDLFFLKTQCLDPVLFVVASLVSSFVYTLIIYSLTITFSVIGKALAVIILVLQVAGSGGTFPIEVLPAPFQAMAPFLPFKYGVNALREAVAGVDYGAYWSDLGYLMLFAVGALFIGLVLRKPCLKVINFFNERVEDSEIVI